MTAKQFKRVVAFLVIASLAAILSVVAWRSVESTWRLRTNDSDPVVSLDILCCPGPEGILREKHHITDQQLLAKFVSVLSRLEPHWRLHKGYLTVGGDLLIQIHWRSGRTEEVGVVIAPEQFLLLRGRQGEDWWVDIPRDRTAVLDVEQTRFFCELCSLSGMPPPCDGGSRDILMTGEQ